MKSCISAINLFEDSSSEVFQMSKYLIIALLRFCASLSEVGHSLMICLIMDSMSSHNCSLNMVDSSKCDACGLVMGRYCG